MNRMLCSTSECVLRNSVPRHSLKDTSHEKLSRNEKEMHILKLFWRLKEATIYTMKTSVRTMRCEHSVSVGAARTMHDTLRLSWKEKESTCSGIGHSLLQRLNQGFSLRVEVAVVSTQQCVFMKLDVLMLKKDAS